MASIISASTTSGTALNMSADTTGVLQLATGATPTTAVTIDTSQNVGIGTASPTTKLYVRGGNENQLTLDNAGERYTTLFLRNNSTLKSYWFWDNSDAATYFGNSANSPLVFLTNDTQRMRIDSSGNLLIGNTSFTSLGYLNVQSATTKDGAVFQSSGTGDTTQILFRNPNGVIGKISTLNSATSYVTSSDYRLKENIVPMTGALDTVAALKPVTYKWKIDGSDGQGFIAHELQAVLPDAVVGEKDAVDEEGNPIHQGVDTSFLVATLTAAIQEQQTIINNLKARIETLETK